MDRWPVKTSDVAFAAFYVLVALPRAAIPLIDGDVWWHIRAGEVVLHTGAIPSSDTWSLVGLGRPWISQDWLTNVGMAAFAQFGAWNWSLLSVAFSLMVVGSLAVLARAISIRAPQTSWLATLLWLTVGLTVAGPTLGVRSQVVDLPLASLLVWVLWKYVHDRRSRWLATLPIIAVFWANLHAGWVLMFLLAGATVVGELIDRRLARRVGSEPLTYGQVAKLALAVATSAVALSVNPNGWELYLYPIESGIGALSTYLAEWAPPSVTGLPGQLLVAFVALGVAPTILVGRHYLRTAELLTLVGLTVMAMSAARFLLFAGPLGAAVVAVGLSPVVGGTRLGRRFGPLLSRMDGVPRGRRPMVNAALIGLVVVIGTAVTAARIHPDTQTRSIAEHMPVAAVDWIVRNDPGDRPFNTYSWGGYLGWRQPQEPVFIDGRADVYGEQPIRAYAEAVTLMADPQTLLNAYDIDHVLFGVGTPLAGWLDEADEWERTYADDLAAVWVRSGE